MNRRKKVLLLIILFPILTLLGFYACINTMLNQIDRGTELIAKADSEVRDNSETNPGQVHKEIINIALFGLDYEKGDKGRSDTIIIMSIDETHNMLKFTSIMRDSYVKIDGHGKDKINHAYIFGGPQLALQTINDNFNLNITKYITVNFTDLAAIVDKLGGVPIDVTNAEASHIPGLKKGGTYNLTGGQTLAYSRIRCLDGGDYERTLRQRKVLQSLYSMLLDKSITQYPLIASEVFPSIKTNLSNNEIMTYSIYIATSKPVLAHTRFPRNEDSNGKQINGIYYLVFQEKETSHAIKEFIFKANS